MRKNRENKKWYELDAFAKTYSSIISEGRTTCFRLSVLLSDDIDIKILKKITYYMAKKYSFFNSELRKGLFWSYLQHKNSPFLIEEEKVYPCTAIEKKKPVRIIYYKNKISVEIAHFLTDGIGASIFFKDLIKNYLDYKYYNKNSEKLLDKNDDENVENESNFNIEYVDLYKKYMKKVNKEETINKAFHIPIKIEKKGYYYVTTGEIESEVLKNESKKYNTTIGKYLLAVYFKILLDEYPNAKNPVVIGVPVDLRKVYEEKTFRNFFINITPTLDTSVGNYTLEEIIKYLSNYFEIKINKKEFLKNIYKAMNPIKNYVIRIVPYFVKRLFFPFIFDYYAERGYTTGFSNLGVIKLEEKYEKYIKGYRFLPPPSKKCKIKMAVVGDSKKIYVSFGNLSNNNEVEKNYFSYLRKLGIRSKIITNY